MFQSAKFCVLFNQTNFGPTALYGKNNCGGVAGPNCIVVPIAGGSKITVNKRYRVMS